MKSSSNFLYPFKEIETYLDKNVYTDLKIFYNQFQNEIFGHRIHSIEQAKNSFLIMSDNYNDKENEYDVYTFENHIKYKFAEIIYKVLDLISEGINICFISKQSVFNYLEKVERDFNILSTNKALVEFDFLQYYVNLISIEIKYYKSSEAIVLENGIFTESLFKVKEHIKRTFFLRLFEIAQRNDIIDVDFSQEDFYDVFTASTTEQVLKFNCSNTLMIIFLESIKGAFDNFTSKILQQSKRFKTKQGNLLTITNYDSSKQRIIQKELPNSVKNLEEEILDILLQV